MGYIGHFIKNATVDPWPIMRVRHNPYGRHNPNLQEFRRESTCPRLVLIAESATHFMPTTFKRWQVIINPFAAARARGAICPQSHIEMSARIALLGMKVNPLS